MKKIIVFLALISFICAKDIRVALGDKLAPYIIEPNSGMEYEIIKSAFELKSYKMIPVFVPFARLAKSAETGAYDVVATINEDSKIKNVYYSDSYITYENVVVSIKEYKIKSVADLKNKSIIAFQDANIYLGKEFADVVKNNPNYFELANQEGQVASLMKERVEVVVTDLNIFKYYYNKSSLFKQKQYIVYRIFKPTYYKLAFKDKKIRDDFNLGLKLLKNNGNYTKILKKYTE